jgi:hypothetical protein
LPKRASRSAGRSYEIDRLIRDAKGIRWVMDFKTSRQERADVEGFLDREQQRYAAQLDAYAAALGGASRGGYTFRCTRAGGRGKRPSNHGFEGQIQLGICTFVFDRRRCRIG